MPRRLLAPLRTAALALLAGVAGLTTWCLPAAAENGLDTASETTYTVDATAGVVHVRVDVTFVNSIPDRTRDGSLERAYFTGFALPVPVGAANPVATADDGVRLAVEGELVPDNSNYFLYNVAFARSLFSGESTHIVVVYDVTGQPLRSANPSRVNRAYISFNAYGIGDAGAVTVRVVVPDGFTVDAFGPQTEVSRSDGTVVYTARDISDPNEFGLFVSARNDANLDEAAVSTAERAKFSVRAWPGDDAWTAFVTDQIRVGVPALGDLVGQPWPITGPVVVREAYTPYLYGYSGWFRASDRQIEIGERLDQEVVLHELAHAWFSDDWFTDRWINEGLAQTYSNLAIAELGGVPAAPVAIDGSDPAMIDLNDWGAPQLTTGATAVETYGYNASWSVISQIVEQLGSEAMRNVFAAAREHRSAYSPDDVGASVGAGWRRFLDLVDRYGRAPMGAESPAAALIAAHVATPEQVAELTRRTPARAAYSELERQGGAWTPPAYVRTAMANWSFDAALPAIAAATEILRHRDDLAVRAAQLGVALPDRYRDQYIAAQSLEPVAAALRGELDAANDLLSAQERTDRGRGLLERVGLIGADLDELLVEGRAALSAGQPDLARSRADEVERLLDDADERGQQRSLLAAGAAVTVIVLVAGLVVVIRRVRRSVEPGAADAESSEAIARSAEVRRRAPSSAAAADRAR